MKIYNWKQRRRDGKRPEDAVHAERKEFEAGAPETAFSLEGRSLLRPRARLEDERIVLAGWAPSGRYKRVIPFCTIAAVSLRRKRGGKILILTLRDAQGDRDETLRLELAEGARLWYYAIQSRASAKGTDFDTDYDSPYAPGDG